MGKRARETIQDELNKLRDDVRRIHESYEETEKEFQKWKESVLKFEHFEYGTDDDSGGDDRVCDGESVWPGEDEDDLQRYSGQADEEYESDCESGEERGNT